MAEKSKAMTTREFAQASGIPSSTISRLIREGKLKAKKAGGKWMIPASQLEAKIVREFGRPAKALPAKSAAKPEAAKAKAGSLPPKTGAAAASESQSQPPAQKTYSVAEFAAMTYFTEKGVVEWLKARKLKGMQLENGDWRILASSLDLPAISRLVRK
jgi:excisionase family DNA binding protein